MKKNDFFDFDLLAGIDEIVSLMESDVDLEDTKPEFDVDIESDYTGFEDAADDQVTVEDVTEDSGSQFFDKIKETCDIISENTALSYTQPDEKTLVTKKTSAIFIASFAVAFVAIAVGLYFFFTSFNYYTTGLTVDEFIYRFNNLPAVTSDSDIYEIIPSYTDVVIPEDAKLNSKNTIELFDGHIVLKATTRFGKIVKLSVINSEFPGYNPNIFYFDNTDDPNYLYYYAILGKAMAAFDDEITNIYDATYSAYQMHQYAYLYMFYGQEPKCSVTVGDNDITYFLREAFLSVSPVTKQITTAVWPEWITELFARDEEPESVTGGSVSSSSSDIA